MAGITLTIDVDDKGTFKVKQFADESKKAFKEMTDGPKAAQGPLDTLKESWMAITAKVAIATAAFYAAKRLIYDTAVQIAAATNEIEKQARILGISTDELQKWQYAAKMSDVNAQELAIGIKMLSMNMEAAATGVGDANQYFSAMGVSVKTTEGHLRPLNQVMGDIMDKFASWEDGPRKIAIAMQLFGRSGETLIPLLNKGRAGFNELAEEARKLGIILSPDLVKKGSEAEDIFKKINAQLEAGKLKFAPYALEVAKTSSLFLESLNKVKDWVKNNPQVWDYIVGAIPGSAGFKTAAQSLSYFREEAKRLRDEGMMAWEPGATPIPKGKPPEIGGKESDIVKEIMASYEAMVHQASEYGEMIMAQHELAEGGWSKEKDIVQEVREEIERLERETNEWGEITVARQELVEAGWAATTKAEEDAITEGMENARLLHQAWLEAYAETPKTIRDILRMESTWQELGNTINSVWSENVTGILKGTTTIADAFKNMVKGMADAFISSVAKMITNWILFENIKGTYKSGAGLMGWIGSLFGVKEGGVLPGGWVPIHAFQEGGMITRPTLGMIGEGGPEAVIPLKGGKIPIEMGKQGKGDTYVYFVNPIGFDQALMKNMGTILKGIAKDARMAGPMYSIMKGNG